jgi:hypothetical protein
MQILDDFRNDVAELESGKCPSRFHNRGEARDALVNAICGYGWRTAAEREEAQILVIRLARLRVGSVASVPVAAEPARRTFPLASSSCRGPPKRKR